MLDHECGEAGAIDEDDFLGDGGGVVDGTLAEAAGGDEDALVRLLAGEGTDEALDLRAANGVLPALGLDVDDIEAEAVFIDDAVNAFVIRLLGDAGGFLAGAAVAHGEEEIDDQLLETEGFHGEHRFQKGAGEGGIEFLEGLLNALVGREGVLLLDLANGFRPGVFLVLGRMEPFAVARDGIEELEIELGGRIGEEGKALRGDAVVAAADLLDQSGLIEMGAGPTDAVGDLGGLAAGNHFLAVRFANLEGVLDAIPNDGGVFGIAIGKALQEGKEHFLESGNGHDAGGGWGDV